MSYNLCKAFNALPSQIEKEDDYQMNAFAYIEDQLQKKTDRETKKREMEAKQHGR